MGYRRGMRLGDGTGLGLRDGTGPRSLNKNCMRKIYNEERVDDLSENVNDVLKVQKTEIDKAYKKLSDI
jgi:hypothetical protein